MASVVQSAYSAGSGPPKTLNWDTQSALLGRSAAFPLRGFKSMIGTRPETSPIYNNLLRVMGAVHKIVTVVRPLFRQARREKGGLTIMQRGRCDQTA